MGLDPHVVDQLVALVREQFPDWAGFDHEGFRREERDYKVAAVEKAIGPDGLLEESALREDLDGRAFNSFIDRFDKVGHATNLLYQSVPMSGDLSALYHARENTPVLEGFCRALFDLLWGEGPSPERFGRYVDFVTANDLPNKWTLPTYFLFLTHPDEDMFIKPRTMARVAKYLDTDWSLQGAPTGEEYGRILEWARELRAALEPYGVEDMIDVQSLLWTAGWQLGQSAKPPEGPARPTRYWKVAPREGAALWNDWQERAHVSVGWDELGDLSALTPDEWPAHRDSICSEYGWTTAGADQCWRFAKEIAPGDRIVANRGTKGIVGFGTVVGDYYFVPNEVESHRLPVRWDDVTPRTLPQRNHGWRRTLLELAPEEFDGLVALPPASGEKTLGHPFDLLFADRDEAGAALGLMSEAVQALGVTSPDDPRFAVTYSRTGRKLTLDYGPWCIMRCRPVDQARRLQLALLERAGVLADVPVDFRFREAGKDRRVVLRTIEPSALTDEGHEVFLQTATEATELFGHRQASNYRAYHVKELGEALFDEEKLEALLTNGLSEATPEPGVDDLSFEPVDHPAFSAKARDLLVAMEADPTKAFYAEHKQGLIEHVQEPVRAFLKRIAARVSPQLRDSLEMEKRLFGVFNKNDYGRGGAWPFYWGAFYPLGGTKTRDCQLFVTLTADGFSYGFSIGTYASDNHRRFKKNARENRQALAAALGDTISAPEFHFGDANRSDGEKGVSAPAGLDLDAWFALIETSGPQVHVDVFWDELLATEMAALEARVTDAFNRLFPLVLLGTLDDPLPAIDEYLQGTDDQQDEDPNPAYSIEDLAAETSMPRENLHRWLRAIERKGQAILYGPPGTGKTYVAERLAKHLVAGGTGLSELVQFHPAYAYEDFMQGIRPKARDGGGLDYPVVDGRFKQFCQQARGRKGLSVLIIDEVNRANLARVFGELMYLLEYRDKSIPLAAGGTFSIPGNVRIIGTMNTADRSIALVDHALRRRFAFLPLYPDYQMLTDFHTKAGKGFDPAKLIAVLKELNRKIGDHHYEVGTSFFLREDIAAQLPDVWAMEIEPYLEEYFFDQQATVEAYRWDEVKNKLDLE